ncbi:hypothetical protein P261_00259 [Lachnospiraceae bacterium TWA4]|nr:hypothetical protein P261_00259 [Lachnospiraceae bacterium TWA4]
MIISEKLYQLRNRSGLSQEELAEKMNVSRQSISKWESGSSIPTIDKILELSKIYGVSTDFLLRDDLEEFPGEVVPNEEKFDKALNLTMETVTDYLNVVKVSANKISLGVLLCIVSPVVILILEGLRIGHKIPWSEDMVGGIGAAALLGLVAVAVMLFITSALRLKSFDYLNTDVFSLDYGVAGVIEKEEKEYVSTFIKGISMGVAFCIIAVIPLIITVGFNEENEELLLYMTAILLLIIACGVHMIVLVNLRKSAYSKLLQIGDYRIEEKNKRKKLEKFSGIYWGLVTAIYLGISFWKMNWHISWIIWPVAGAFSAVAYSVAEMVLKDE